MTVFPLEAVAGRHGRFTVVVFPNFIIARRPGPAAQRTLLQNVALVVTIQFDESRFLALIEPIR